MPSTNLEPELPFQHLLQQDLFQVYSLSGFRDELSEVPHRHDFYLLIWGAAGQGMHRIDFQPFEMYPDRVFFLRPGQVHQIVESIPEGQLVVFEETLLNQVMQGQAPEEQFAVFDYFNQAPYVDLGAEEREVYGALFRFLQQERQQEKPDLTLVSHYLFLLLHHGHKLHLQQHTRNAYLTVEHIRIRDLRLLMEQRFKEEHETEYYSRMLGVSTRKLNELTRQVFGMTVHQLLQERLLTESRYLLVASPLTVKEIAYELGFSDPAYFGRFFKKHMGVSPAAYKEARTK